MIGVVRGCLWLYKMRFEYRFLDIEIWWLLGIYFSGSGGVRVRLLVWVRFFYWRGVGFFY